MQALRVVDTTTNESAAFDDFWLLYPKRIARRDAEKAWNKLSDADRLAAIVGAAKWRRPWIARGEMQYVPNASTWLNGARWEDELPAEQVSSSAAHQPAKFAQGERGTMPEEVKALLAKLRAGR